MFSLLIAEFNPKMGKQPNSSSEFLFRKSAEEFVTNITSAAKGKAMAGLSLPFYMWRKAFLAHEEIESKN